MTTIANKGQTNITNQSQIIIALCKQTLNTCSVCVEMRLWFSIYYIKGQVVQGYVNSD